MTLRTQIARVAGQPNASPSAMGAESDAAATGWSLQTKQTIPGRGMESEV